MLQDVRAAYLQVDLDDSVKLVLLHVEQEVVLCDSCCVHTHWGRLKVTSLQRERRLTVNRTDREEKRGHITALQGSDVYSTEKKVCISLKTLHIMAVIDTVCFLSVPHTHTHTHTCILVTSFFTLSFDDTSTTAAMWPCPLRSLDRLPRVSLADSSLMSATTTEAPSEAKRWHTDRPIPLPPPGRGRKAWSHTWAGPH